MDDKLTLEEIRKIKQFLDIKRSEMNEMKEKLKMKIVEIELWERYLEEQEGIDK